MGIIEAESLTRHYGRRLGIERIGLSIPEGTLFGFLGPNGSGKTTTIRVLMGFLRATRGEAFIFGRDCWLESHRIKEETGYLPGDLRLYHWMTGHEALRIFGAVRRRDLIPEGRRLAELFELVLDVKVRKMSRGMRQKLGLILAMVHRPRLLILDEPSSGLDPLMQERLRVHLRDMASDGHTVFFSSHTLSEVESVCDHVAILREGRLVADASLDDLRREAKRRVWIRFRESSAIPDAPPFLCVERSGLREWSARLEGSVSELIEWAATRPIDDLSIGQADLEELFRSHYSGGKA